MAAPDPTGPAADRPSPGQTIIIERRERGGWIRRILSTLFTLFVIAVILTAILNPNAGGPQRLSEKYVAGELTGPKIAVVEVEGVIFDAEAEHAVRQLRQARDDDQVKAVVLRVDSPGGAVSAADRIWREVEILKGKNKPVVASMGGLAASGGYYVSAPADAIFAEPTTITGSIGVIMEMPQVGELLKKVGVEMQAITTGPWKDSGSPFRPMKPEERDRWQEMIGDAYERFIRVIAQGRNLPLDEVRALANGKVYTATEARNLKLVNQIGYLDDAILDAQNRGRLEKAHVVRYAKGNPLEALLGVTSRRPAIQIDAEALYGLQVPKMLFLAR